MDPQGMQTVANNNINAILHSFITLEDLFELTGKRMPYNDCFEIIKGSAVAQCLTRDRGAAGSSLTGVTALWSLSKTHLS